VGIAYSDDNGLQFKKYGDGPILSSSLHEPFLVGDAFVRVIGDTWHMWYIFGTCWMENTEEEPARIYKIAHATSADGFSWNRDGRQIITDKLGPEECQALPTVIFHNGSFHMYFCYRYATGFRKIKERGYKLGYAFSNDGVFWTRDDENKGIDLSEQGWDADMMCYPHIFECNENLYLLYNGNEFGRNGFGLAILEG
jgi:hypothetical protein